MPELERHIAEAGPLGPDAAAAAQTIIERLKAQGVPEHVYSGWWSRTPFRGDAAPAAARTGGSSAPAGAVGRSDDMVRYSKTVMAMYNQPPTAKNPEGDYRGPIRQAGQPLRLTGRYSPDGMYAEVVALNPDGSEQKSRGWVERSLLKSRSANLQTLSLFERWMDAGQPGTCSFLKSWGRSSCARSLRTTLGYKRSWGDAWECGPGLVRDGYKRRSGRVVYPGDIVIYGRHQGSTYRGGSNGRYFGHIGIAVEHNGQMMLFSHLNDRWQLSPLGRPDEVYWRP